MYALRIKEGNSISGTYTQSYVPTTGDTITVARWNSAWNDHNGGADFVGLGDYSASDSEMQTTTDPSPSAATSRPTDGKGELERIRYLIKQISGKSQWYVDAAAIGSKGADVASTAALPVLTDGNFFDVTGTTAITSINTLGIGSQITLQFDDAVVLTHHATDLILPNGINITTIAGDTATFVEYASGDWIMTGYSRPPSFAKVCEGRLTLTTATAVTTSDVTAATTIYFTPYRGNQIALYNGTQWGLHTFTELSIAVPATTATMYDLWVYNNSGTLALEALAWTNNTTRATALALQNGVYCKTGALTRRYVGSFRTTGVSGQTEDSEAKRYLWNYYNRVCRVMAVVEGTNSWEYTTATWRQANNSATNQLDFIVGVAEELVWAEVRSQVLNATTGVGIRAGIALDATNTNNARLMATVYSTDSSHQHLATAMYEAVIAVGRHFLAWVEYSEATGTTTFYGDDGDTARVQSGIVGKIFG